MSGTGRRGRLAGMGPAILLVSVTALVAPGGAVAGTATIERAGPKIEEVRTELARRWINSRARVELRGGSGSRPPAVQGSLQPGGASLQEVAPRGRAARVARRVVIFELPAGEQAADAEVLSQPRTYRVKAGDTLSGIAVKVYGRAEQWRRIAEANPRVDPARLRVGQELTLPGTVQEQARIEPESAAAASGSTTDRTPRSVVVRQGETLSHVSQRVYGRAGLWRHLMEANGDRLKRPEQLRAGMELHVPDPPRQL